MQIDNAILKYLRGEVFSNALEVKIRRTKYEVRSREELIIELINNKDVVHLGCADHKEIIPDKISRNIWLHKLISDAARSCVGIDINKESIEYIVNELGYSNVFFGDIMKDSVPEILENRWDYIVFGELIEHLDNPVDFLRTFKMKYGEHINKFIITVPNVFSRLQIRNILSFNEVINSDHRFWFSPYTISKLLVNAGYIPEEISYCNLSRLRFSRLLVRKLKKVFGLTTGYPYYYFNTIVVTGTLN